MTNPAIRGLERLPDSFYLGLGSNLGNRESKIREAIGRIEALGLEITKASSIYETEPVGYANQPWFLNQVIEVRVDLELTSISEAWSGALFMREGQDEDEMAAGLFALSDREPGIASMFWALGLLGALLGIEREMGRERTILNGPRAIDIDILMCGEMEGAFAETRDDPATPGYARAEPPFLTLPHPRLHERRFVLEPLCEIAPHLVHPTLKKTCRELLASLEDRSVVRLYEKS